MCIAFERKNLAMILYKAIMLRQKQQITRLHSLFNISMISLLAEFRDSARENKHPANESLSYSTASE